VAAGTKSLLVAQNRFGLQKDGSAGAQAPAAPRAKNNVGANQAGALRSDRANLLFDEMNVLFAAPTVPPAMRAGLPLP
jgi:hypothetical protein